MARRPNGNGKLDKLDDAMTALVQAQAQLVQNQSALQQTTATLQQATATLLQNQALAQKSFQELTDRMDQKFAEVDRRLEHIEATIVKMLAEMPERIFAFAQSQKKQDRFAFTRS